MKQEDLMAGNRAANKGKSGEQKYNAQCLFHLPS